MSIKEMVCIVCPNGCKLQAELDGETINVTGNRCKRGVDFARAELIHPARTLTTTVKTAFPSTPVLPVRTQGEIPRELIFKAMQELNKIVVETPVSCGDIVAVNLLSTGCNVIATSDILTEKQ